MSIEGQGHFLTLAKGRVHTKFKLDFLRNFCADVNQILYEIFQAQGRHDAGHKVATPIYGKNPSKILSRTGGPISTKLGRYMKHPGLQPIIHVVCSNDDPGVTLTYFTTRSNFVT